MRSHERRRGGGQSSGTWKGCPQGNCGKGKFPATSFSSDKVAGMDASRAPGGQMEALEGCFSFKHLAFSHHMTLGVSRDPSCKRGDAGGDLTLKPL